MEKTCSQSCYERLENLEGKFSGTRLPFHLVTAKPMKICCAEGMHLNLAFLKLSDAISVLIIYICTCSSALSKPFGYLIHVGYCRRSWT